MKKILFVIGLLISFLSQGQTWSKITTGSKYTYTTYLGTLRSDSGLIIPTYNSLTTPYFKDTIGNLVRYHDSLFFRTSTGWRNIGGSGILANAFVQGGNSFGATANVGTNDNYDFQLRANGNTQLIIGKDGTVYSPTYNWSFNTDYSFQLGSDAGFNSLGYLRVPNKGYLNFSTSDANMGSSGFGFRDSAGLVQFKDSLGVWKRFASAGNIGDTLYAKLNYDNTFTGLNTFSDGKLKLKGTSGGGVKFHYLDAGVSQEELYYPYSYSDTVAYQSWVENYVNSNSGKGTVKSVKLTTPTGLTTTGSPITDTGTLAITYTSGYSLPTTASQALWDAAYTNRITTANAPLSITSNTIKIDTTTRFTGVATLGKAYNDSLVLAAAIATKGSGSVTSVATGLGLSGGTITTSGTLLVDTSSTSILSRQRAVATYAPISINGTVTSVTGTSGLGISASVANSTTTPNITIAVDTSDASILSRQRAAATYLPLTGGVLSSRLTGTSLILNKDSLPTVTGKTWGLVIDTGNSNRISRQILPTATGTVTSITLGRGITGSSPITTTGTIGLDTSKGYTWTGINTIKDSIYIPKIVGGTGINSGIDFYSSSNPASVNANDFNFYGWDALGNRTRKAYLQSTAGGVFHCNTITSISSSVSLESMSGSVQFAPTGIYCGAVSYTSSIPTLIITNGGGNAGKICVGGNPAASTAMFEMQSTTKGLLPPRMTTTQKNAISSPAEGLIVYDLTLHKLSIYTGSIWETITSL